MSSVAKVPLTVAGAEALKAELQRLKHKDRPAVIQAISEARAQGDLSENAEYDAAKEKQSFVEGRILDIEGKLSSAQIINTQCWKTTVVWCSVSRLILKKPKVAIKPVIKSSARTKPI